MSLAGRFIVLKPNKAHSGGVSRRIMGEDRDLARQSLNDVDIPDNMSVILRTAGIERSAEELAWDLENLLKVWQAILDSVLRRPSPFLIYRESNAVIRALRDYLSNEIGEILIDDEPTFKEALEFVEQVMPHNARKLKFYSDPVPLFTRFQIESQIETAFAHQVNLPSGGSIVIDHTEALVAIDVNSARATKGGDIETTALNTNLEAAEEVARQLRVRDLGGLVVIDFIDMSPQKNQREVENRLRESVRQDRARVQIGKITRFGLLEMSRQRLRPSIGESAYHTCPRCTGFGTIRSIESLALAILRIIGEEARKERTAKVIAQLPVEVATYLLNEKRDWVKGLETSNDTQVVLVANARLETPHYDIRRVRDDQTELPENAGASYALAQSDPIDDLTDSIEEKKVAEQAAIGVINPTTPAPAPTPARKETGGFFAWLKAFFTSDPETKKPAKSSSRSKHSTSNTSRGRGSQRQRKPRSEQGKSSGNTRQRPSKSTSKKAASSGQGAKKKRAKQQARDPQADSIKNDAPRAETAASDTNGEEQKRSSRNRRSRGGRRRRRSADRPDDDRQQAQSGDNAEKSAAQASPATAESKPVDSKPAASKPDAPIPSTVEPAAVKASAPEPAAQRAPAPKPSSTATAATGTSSSAAAKPMDDKVASGTVNPTPGSGAEKASKSNGDKATHSETTGTPKSSEQAATRLLPWEPAAPVTTTTDKPAPKAHENTSDATG